MGLTELLVREIPDLLIYKSIIDAVILAAKVTEYIRAKVDYGRITKPDASPVTGQTLNHWDA